MSFTDLQKLRDFLEEHIDTSSDQFILKPGEIGSEQVDDIIEKYLSDKTKSLVLKSPTTPTVKADEVVFSGIISTLLGLSPALIHLYFGLLKNGSVTMLVSLYPASNDQPKPVKDWNLGVAFPGWKEIKSPLTGLKFEVPVFYISSIAMQENSDRPDLSQGLNFSAEKLLETGLLGVFDEKFTSAFKFTRLAGAITNTLTAPYTTITSDPTTPIRLGKLDLPVTFIAVAQSKQPEGILSFLQIGTSIPLGSAHLPVEARSGGEDANYSLVAPLQEINDYAVSAFSGLVNGAPIGQFLSKYVDIGHTVGLKDLEIILDKQPFGILAVDLNFSTRASIVVIEHYVEIPDISAQFNVKDPMGSKEIGAMVSGSFDFVEEVPVVVTATYPDMVFNGGVKKNQNLHIQKVFQHFIPNADFIPDVSIGELNVSADLNKKDYQFDLMVTSEWKIPVGIAQFQMADAKINLRHQKSKPGFSGDIGTDAVLYDQSGQKISTFAANWELPGNFLIKGEFPEIKLSELATTLTGAFLKSTEGLPEINLVNSAIALSINRNPKANFLLVDSASNSYNCTLSTEIDANKIGKAELYFEVLKSEDKAGFLAAIAVQPQFTPDALWPGLKTVFEIIQIKEAGMVLSSIQVDKFNPPNFEKLPYKPDKIQSGITFFSQLELKGDAFELIGKLFDSDIAFDLYAFINPGDIQTTEVKASLPASQGQGILTFNGLSIDLKPGETKFSITASAKLKIQSEELALVGSGTLVATPPNVAFAIDIHCWKEPFGIRGLTVIDFGLSVGISEIVTLGLLGHFLIGEKGDQQFKFLIGGEIIDFEAPGAFVFGLDSPDPNKPLKIVDLITQYTSLDLKSVPLISELAFKNLDFYVVDDPNGWTAPNGHLYKPGIGLDADIIFYSYELKLRLEVNWDKGIIANGNLNQPIDILDILIISDDTGKLGPSASIDTTNLPAVAYPHGLSGRLWEARVDEDCSIDYMDRITYPPQFTYPEDCQPAVMGFLPLTILTTGDQSSTYFSFTGGIHFLGLEEKFSGSATKDGFEVNFRAQLAELFKATFMCTYKKGKDFQGAAHGNFDFNMDFPNGLTLDGVPILPPFSIHGPYASLDIECAINLKDPYFSFALKFNWGSFTIDVNFNIDPQTVKDLLSNLWEHIKDWINHHLEEFFKDLLSDANKFVKAIKDGVLSLGQSAYFIARALFEHFKSDMTQVAKYLYETLSFGYDVVVHALVRAFDASLEEVLKLMSELFGQCATKTANAIISSEP